MVKKRKMYVVGRGNGKSTFDLQRAIVGQPSYTAYCEYVKYFGGSPRSWLWFQLARLRQWWLMKRIEWRINHG